MVKHPVLIIRHGHNIPAGYLGDVLADAGVPVATLPLYAGAPVPDHLEWSAVVSLGGVMGAYQGERYPYLGEEKRFLREAVEADIPVLGICLGCQLLADTLGGSAYKAGAIELGHKAVALTDAGAADPVVSHLNAPTLIWHEDTWDVPPNGELLAETDMGPMAFRLGSALALQPHAEVSPGIVAEWVSTEGLDHFERTGVDKDELLASLEAARDEGEAMARAVFSTWLEEAID